MPKLSEQGNNMKLLRAILKTVALLFVILLALFVGEVVDLLLEDAGFNHFKLLVLVICCIYLVAYEYFELERNNMNTTERELLERCKEALDIGLNLADEKLTEWTDMYTNSFQPEVQARLESNVKKLTNTIKDIEACLAKPVQEPVAYGYWDTMAGKSQLMMVRLDKNQDGCTIPLYTAPQSREPMSEDDIKGVLKKIIPHYHKPAIKEIIRFARAIEAHPDAGLKVQCRCATCKQNHVALDADMRMIVCAKCGNKRCPHATNHLFACTNSNEVGQAGSAYQAVRS